MYAAALVLLCVLPSLRCAGLTNICVKEGVTTHFIDPDAKTILGLARNSTIFVDKTLFIKEMLELPHNLLYISLPPKFGKSINLDMVRLFVEMPVDKFGESLPRFESEAYLFFKQGTVHNGNLTEQYNQPMISRHTFLFDDYLCRYPVIYLDFSNIQATNLKEFKEQFAECIRQLFHHHQYVVYMLDKRESSESSVEKHKFLELMNYVEKGDLRLEHSVRFLSQLLSKVHHKGIFIFIDGFDVLYDLALHGEFPKNELSMTLEFMRYFYKSTFYHNMYLKKAIVMAYNRNAAILLPATGKPLMAHHALNNQFFMYFGVTQIDADTLSDHFGISAELRHNASEFYNGYQFSPVHVSPVINVWTLANFLNTKSVESYWLYISKARFFLRYLIPITEIRRQFERLFHGELIIGASFSNNYTAAVGKLYTMREIIQNPRPQLLNSPTSRAMAQYFADYGILTLNRTEKHGNKQQRINHLRIPNLEIRSEIYRDLRAYYTLSIGIPGGPILQLTEHLDQYVTGQSEDNHLLQDAFTYVFKNLTIDVDSNFNNTRNYTRFNNTVMNAVIEFLTIEMRHNYGYEVRVFSVPGFKLFKNNRGAVIKTNYFYNSTPGDILSHGIHDVWFPEMPDIKDPKIIVLEFTPDNSVILHETLLGPQNIPPTTPPTDAAQPHPQPEAEQQPEDEQHSHPIHEEG